MRFIRFDSVGGASGDMILAALIGLGVDPLAVTDSLRGVIQDEFQIFAENLQSYGVSGTRVTVEVPGQSEDFARHREHHHHPRIHHQNESLPNATGCPNDLKDHSHGGHHHRSFADIRKMIETSKLPQDVKINAVAVFSALADAEGAVHGKPPEEISFHEVGATDSIVDILGAAIGFHILGIESISIGPIPIGSGTVCCAHGIYPVPAPAVTKLLETYKIPVKLDGGEGEMLTPTGAVLLGWWKKVPSEQLRSACLLKSANALGHRKFPDRPNLLRASLYETNDGNEIETIAEKAETLIRLDANLDDTSGEILAHSAEILFQTGALDVWFTPIQMKKGRPAVMISVLTTPNKRADLIETIFRQTGTFGVRETLLARYALDRRFSQVVTSGGKVAVKSGFFRGEEVQFAPEFADCAAAAASAGTTAVKIYREAVAEYQNGNIIGSKVPRNEKETTDERES